MIGDNMLAAMMSMGPNVLWGVALFNLLMGIAGIFYLICALFLWKRVRAEKNELLSALFAFLVYQAINMFFIATFFQTGKHIYGYISGISILIGSMYMLKFPFHSFAAGTRKAIFIISLIVVIAIFGWFITHPALFMIWTNFTLWYDFIINGLVVGGSIVFFAFYASDRRQKIKAAGGGTGVMACCIVGNATLISGALVVSSIFQFLAPIIILLSLASKKNQNPNPAPIQQQTV
jgi:hypothetical protein